MNTEPTNGQGWGEFVWYQRDTTIPLIGQAAKAYNLVINEFLLACQHGKIPHEFVYCPESDTTNISFPKKIIVEVTWQIRFKDAGFIEKPIPLKDAIASAELKEALLAGSDFNKLWH